MSAQEQESEFSATGFNVLRIESEDKLLVPLDLAEDAWTFLLDFLVRDTAALRALDPAFTSFYSEELFTDTYYDTPELQLIGTQNGVRHRRRVNLSNPDDRKSGRELLQIKINNISGRALERGEYKFEIEHPTRVNQAEDAHPLFGIVRPSHRRALQERLAAIGLDPSSMRPILTIRDFRRRIYIERDGKPFMSVSHDHATSKLLWARVEFVEIEPELNEVHFTEADPAMRRYMEGIAARISAAIMERFPAIERDLTPKYNKMFHGFETQIPMLRLLIRTNLLDGEMLLAALLIGVPAVAVGLSVPVRTWLRKRQRTAGEGT